MNFEEESIYDGRTCGKHVGITLYYAKHSILWFHHDAIQRQGVELV